MLTEEIHAAGVAAEKVLGHEEAAHEKRNWVRLTYDCNNRCVFCLDSDTHVGEMRDREEVRRQILDGRRAGATRLILSGGEPTIHPDYVDFVRLGARAGYRRVQTVTNGRLFAYPDFLKRCLDGGLGEITFSLHGPNARIHDALVGVKGAFEQEVAGLRNAIADGRAIVNVDIVINRANVRHLKEMLDLFIGYGVREFDLLQVVPFGRAFTEGRDTLFYDLEEMRPHLLEALAYAKRADVHIWMNRFPPQHLEGYEHLIQDPYKLNDEVRGRKEEFARLLDEGVALDCRDPQRCRYCYLEQLCDTLETVRAQVMRPAFEIVRVDSEWEAAQEPAFGGDPAAARRSLAPVDGGGAGKAMRRLPIVDGARPAAVPPAPTDLATLTAGATTLWVRAPDLARARPVLARFPHLARLELELADGDGLAAALDGDGRLDGREVVRVIAGGAAEAEALLEIPAAFEVVVRLNRETAAWLLSLPAAPPRLVLLQPTYERSTEAAAQDVDVADFFARFRLPVPVEGLPACVTGHPERARPDTLDAAMLDAGGRPEIFRYAKRYILAHYRTKSLRCRGCAHDAGCRGLHVNQVRAHGYRLMVPVPASGAAGTVTSSPVP
jgi:MoaA/NifB/PqqE/SkfB family radical SAM enzyme